MFNTTINSNGCAVTPALILATLVKSDLHWEMHHAQMLSLEIQRFNAVYEIKGEVPEGMEQELMGRTHTNVTLMGLPVIIDNEHYPKSLIRLMWGDREVARIEALAVPSAFPGLPDFDLEQKSEREKFLKLTY